MVEDVIRFSINVDQALLDDLRRRLTQTRWPERETVGDWSQGVPLDYLKGLVDYWRDGYDWRATEARVNQLPQITTTIEGLDVHAFHVRSPHAGAVPVVMTHGWPGSFFEFERAIAPLTDPVAHGGRAEDAFHVVVPSLPGYGFSGKPAQRGWGVERIARAWAELMTRLGYDRFIAQGSDWGTSVSTSLARQVPERLLGVHLVPPLVAPDLADLTAAERRALTDLHERQLTGSAYSAVHSTRPQTIGFSLVDSPVGLCAWILEKVWTWTDHDGDLGEVLSADQVLDNVTLYWLTASGSSSARLYWESIDAVVKTFTDPAGETVAVATGCTVFPKEVPRPSRRWAERRFSNIVHWGEPARGGHFGSWEQPDLFVQELRDVSRAIRG